MKFIETFVFLCVCVLRELCFVYSGVKDWKAGESNTKKNLWVTKE
jgi:hypothetical protein